MTDESRDPVRSARAVTDADEAEARRLRDSGLSQTQAAAHLGVSQPDLSRASRRWGLSWWPAPIAGQVQAERLRLARQELAEAALTDALEIRKRLWDKGLEHIATREGVETVETELPSARAVSDLSNAIERLTRVATHAADDASGHTEAAVSMLDALARGVRATVARWDEGGEDERHD
ncbi:hypothetical protein Gbro_1423 [Gordonia bronchialis DSM 43247]|uniref:Uncharacterized protein n=1 Tax=Gordonia bronchialis (strain ATCC 25592 / DSM 43247 / BCRC 13721 / JCM 3198 / KCTC 3076 / NBRC 16047 / NCTC 10667) TaxID=526226 RepID=D0L6E8_GORB4|nr:hypothetical protein [Gordonia bronchialis]ACY20705.1 hypothetical protein Gbro_1423 [Gordonia bronchialis DSM 43247]MCC3323479.1 hypothetical protein [Gordonia bronchialis]QGS25542.1 hypothetical protein FOB84_16755 [Gordonia bronchialis]STQ63534.1 Uncharacterised protein [Gordonia bronchialis]